MTTRPFLAWVWRIKGLIFALGIGGFLVLLFVVDAGRPRHIDNTANVVQGGIDKTNTILSDFHQVGGTGVLRATLELHGKGASWTYSKGAPPIQNYYYYDTASQASHWLLPGHRGRIVQTSELPERYGQGSGEAAPQTVVYQLADTDTNGDGDLTNGDLMTIAISDPAGRGFVRLLDKVENVHGIHLVGKRTLSLIYTVTGEMRAAEVNLDTGKIVRQTALKL